MLGSSSLVNICQLLAIATQLAILFCLQFSQLNIVDVLCTTDNDRSQRCIDVLPDNAIIDDMLDSVSELIIQSFNYCVEHVANICQCAISLRTLVFTFVCTQVSEACFSSDGFLIGRCNSRCAMVCMLLAICNFIMLSAHELYSIQLLMQLHAQLCTCVLLFVYKTCQL